MDDLRGSRHASTDSQQEGERRAVAAFLWFGVRNWCWDGMRVGGVFDATMQLLRGAGEVATTTGAN